MSLEFADFADFYHRSNLSDAQRQEHLASFSAILECIARLFWPHHSPAPNPLGITLDHDSLALLGTVESNEMLRDRFNTASGADAAGSGDQ